MSTITQSNTSKKASKKKATKKNGQRKGLDFDAIIAIREAYLHSTHNNILAMLASRSNPNDHTCYPTQETLAKDTGLGIKTIQRKSAELEKMGLISRSVRGRYGYKIRYNYTLNIAEIVKSKHPRGDLKSSQQGLKVPTAGTQSPHSGDAKSHEVTIEEASEGTKKVEVLSERKSPSVICKSGSLDSQEEIREKSEREEIYIWSPKDTAAARALVWHDFYYPQVDGREIVTGHGSTIRPLIENTEIDLYRMASRLASKYAEATLDSRYARVAYYNECGRLLCPDARKFARSHKLPHEDSELLHRIFDDLGEVACYVIGRTMAEWKFRPDEFPRTNPDLSVMWLNIDRMEKIWLDAMRKVDFPDEDWATELLYSRFFPHKKQEIMNAYSEAVA